MCLYCCKIDLTALQIGNFILPVVMIIGRHYFDTMTLLVGLMHQEGIQLVRSTTLAVSTGLLRGILISTDQST